MIENEKDLEIDDVLAWAQANGINMTKTGAEEIVNVDGKNIDLGDYLSGNETNPIGEYEGLSKKMKAKIQTLIDSLTDDSNDRDEKDTLDELEGKETLSKDKKQQKEAEKDSNDDAKQEVTEDVEKEGEKNADDKEKDKYLADLRRLHKMKKDEYITQMRTGNIKYGPYFKKIMTLQRDLGRRRADFVEKYGEAELAKIENEYLKEELKYENTVNKQMQRDLDKLRALDQKLDSIIDRMKSLQQYLEAGDITLERYNEEIKVLEEDKVEVLWEINKLNPKLLEENQENVKKRDQLEKTVDKKVYAEKKDSISAANKSKKAAIEHNEKQQDGVAEDLKDDIKETIERDIYDKEQKLEELRSHLEGIDINTPEGRKEAFEVIGQINTLEAQKMSAEKQAENLENNTEVDVQSYSDLEHPEQERQETTDDYEKQVEDINPSEVSPGLMEELKNQALQDPETPEEAEEYLDNINEIAEDAVEEKEIETEEKQEEPDAPSLWNRKRPF